MSKRTHAEMLRYIREHVTERIVACEDECKTEGGSDVGQVIAEEAMWLQALVVQIDEHLDQ